MKQTKSEQMKLEQMKLEQMKLEQMKLEQSMGSKMLVVGYFLAFAVLSRFWPHPWNMTAVGALALFSGSQLKNSWFATLLPVTALLISDLALGFHATMPFVYGALILTVFLGQFVKTHPLWLGGASLVSSASFFIISNFGVWMVGGLYPRTTAGLVTCFEMALPFFQWQWLGDLVYTAIIFGGWAVLRKLAGAFAPAALKGF